MLAPLIAIGMLLAAIRSDATMPTSMSDVAAQDIWSGLARSINERHYGTIGAAFLVFVLLGMIPAGLIGWNVETIKGVWVATGTIGAALLGGGVGFFVRPTAPPVGDDPSPCE